MGNILKGELVAMNIVFWILVIVIAIVAWFLLSCAFKPLGDALIKIWKSTEENIKDEQENKDE